MTRKEAETSLVSELRHFFGVVAKMDADPERQQAAAEMRVRLDAHLPLTPQPPEPAREGWPH